MRSGVYLGKYCTATVEQQIVAGDFYRTYCFISLLRKNGEIGE